MFPPLLSDAPLDVTNAATQIVSWHGAAAAAGLVIATVVMAVCIIWKAFRKPAIFGQSDGAWPGWTPGDDGGSDVASGNSIHTVPEPLSQDEKDTAAELGISQQEFMYGPGSDAPWPSEYHTDGGGLQSTESDSEFFESHGMSREDYWEMHGNGEGSEAEHGPDTLGVSKEYMDRFGKGGENDEMPF